MRQHYRIIANPIAGQGKARELIPSIREHLDRLPVKYDIVRTEGVWHAAEIAYRSAQDGVRVVVSAGGDGTANEVINGLMRVRLDGYEPPALAALPVGRGNDFCFGVGVPQELEQACATLATGKRKPLDVGMVTGGEYPEGRYFGNGIGIGFDTIVGLEAAKLKRIRGFLAYVVGAIRTLVIYPDAPQIVVAYDGEERHVSSQQISVMNGRRMGGTFYMAPESLTDDGYLDLCMAVRPLNRRQMIGLVLDYTKGVQTRNDVIATARATHFRLVAPSGGLVCHADGETIATDGDELEIVCVPAALDVLVPT
jgi:YegS/Rv2252/BmrU family lipid kinase